jgi:hypothetical protein
MANDVERSGDDRPAHEIIISPEMVEAGLSHLYLYHPDRGVSDEETVKKIFEAMLYASLPTHI